MLEPRMLLAITPATPVIDAVAATDDSITISWHNTDNASVTLERKGPEDRNYYPAGIGSGGSITQLQPDTTYQFRLRAEIAGTVTYAQFSQQTNDDDFAPGDRTLSAPEISSNVYPYPGPSTVTPVGCSFPEPDGENWTVPPYMYQIRWDGRPECMGGPTWGVYLPELSGPSSPWGADEGDLWFGYNGGWSYSIRAYAQSPQGDHTSNWSEPYGGTTSSPTTSAIGAPTATRTAEGGITLSWSGSTDGFYGIIGGNHNGQTFYSMYPSFITSTYLSPAILGSGRWQFGAMAKGAGGWSSPAMSTAIEVRDPQPVTSVSAYLGDDQDQIRLSWSNTRDETGYRIERRKVYPTTEAWLDAGQTGADVNTSIQTLPSDFAGKKYEFRVIAFDERKDAAASPSAPASGIALQSVTFGGTNAMTISKDDWSGQYWGAQWLDANMNGQIDVAMSPYVNNGTRFGTNPSGDPEQTHPLSYLRSLSGTTSYMSATPGCFYGGSVTGTWVFRGKASGADFAGGTVTANNNQLSWQQMQETKGLSTTISSGKLEVSWELSTDGGGTWFEVGESKNHLYVNGSWNANNHYETVVHLGCAGANGLNPDLDEDTDGDGSLDPGEDAGNGILDSGEDTNGNGILDPGEDQPNGMLDDDTGVVNGIWNQFSGNSTKRVDDTLLRYWHGNAATATSTGMLLKDGNGQCGAWAEFLVDTLRAQGVVGVNKISVTSSYVSDPAVVAANPGLDPRGLLLVKNWSFTGNGTAPQLLAPFTYLPSEYSEQNGAPGQGNTNPPGAFYNHFIVKWNGTYFDPSYGGGPFSGATEEQARAAWEDASLAGFAVARTYIDPTTGQPATGYVAKTNDLGHTSVEAVFTVLLY